MAVCSDETKELVSKRSAQSLQPEEEDTVLTKKNILTYLSDKCSHPVTDELLDMASLIDPKFRTAYIEINKIEKIKKRAITKLLPTEKRTSPPGSFVLLHQEEAQFELKKKKMLGSFFTKKVAPSPQSEADKIETEMTSWCFIHFI
ncbi:zinc finger BED domain-containing protein 1-like [Tachysurus ichikawai]